MRMTRSSTKLKGIIINEAIRITKSNVWPKVP
jgi:hypothetical protein